MAFMESHADHKLSLLVTAVGAVPLFAFDLRETVAKSVEPFAAISRVKGLELSVSLCPGLALAYPGDPVRIRPALHNLISSALIAVTANVRAHQLDEYREDGHLRSQTRRGRRVVRRDARSVGMSRRGSQH